MVAQTMKVTPYLSLIKGQAPAVRVADTPTGSYAYMAALHARGIPGPVVCPYGRANCLGPQVGLGATPSVLDRVLLHMCCTKFDLITRNLS
jgi:hypothetical protein